LCAQGNAGEVVECISTPQQGSQRSKGNELQPPATAAGVHHWMELLPVELPIGMGLCASPQRSMPLAPARLCWNIPRSSTFGVQPGINYSSKRRHQQKKEPPVYDKILRLISHSTLRLRTQR